MITETGVMIVKDGKGWGVVYDDGRSKTEGWVDMDKAEIHEPKYMIQPTDATYKGSHDEQELKLGKIIKVRRTITIEEIA